MASQSLCPSISNVSWDEATHAWYEQQRQSRGGLIFSKLDNLFGHVVTHNTLVCCNDLPSHPASRGVSPVVIRTWRASSAFPSATRERRSA
jgi:hypothetical protein